MEDARTPARPEPKAESNGRRRSRRVPPRDTADDRTFTDLMRRLGSIPYLERGEELNADAYTMKVARALYMDAVHPVAPEIEVDDRETKDRQANDPDQPDRPDNSD